MPDIVIADAGPLLAFSRLHQLELLPKLFERVMVTDDVFAECTCRSDLADAQIIQQAFSKRILQRCTTPDTHFELALHVDAGEASAIAVAIESGCGVLMDDKAGRRMAKNLGVAAIGTAGVLVLAKQKQLIPAVKPLLEQLTMTGYFLGDDLIAHILHTAGES